MMFFVFFEWLCAHVRKKQWFFFSQQGKKNNIFQAFRPRKAYIQPIRAQVVVVSSDCWRHDGISFMSHNPALFEKINRNDKDNNCKDIVWKKIQKKERSSAMKMVSVPSMVYNLLCDVVKLDRVYTQNSQM